jgi:hypothetical protein
VNIFRKKKIYLIVLSILGRIHIETVECLACKIRCYFSTYFHSVRAWRLIHFGKIEYLSWHRYQLIFDSNIQGIFIKMARRFRRCYAIGTPIAQILADFAYDPSLDALEELNLFAEKDEKAKAFLQKAVLPEKLRILSQ